MTTLYLHQPGEPPRAVAVNYTKSEPPPVTILADWLKIANVTNTTPAELRAQLMTGRDVQLGSAWLRWEEE